MLLAVDTSTMQVGIAVYQREKVLAETIWTSQKHHTSELAPALTEILARCDVKIQDIEALGVAIGPGSFTSLRVGLALMKGISMARHLPLIGIPTLDILAEAQPGSKLPLVAIIPAGRGRIAFGWYKYSKNGWQSLEAPHSSTAAELASEIKSPTIIAGEYSAEDRQRLARKYTNVILTSPARSVRRPAILAELAWKRWQSGKTDSAASLAPIYLNTSEPFTV